MRRLARNELKSEFPDLEYSLRKYCEAFPEYDMHEMLREVLLGNSVLWKGDNSFAIGAPVEYHNTTVFLMECTAGDLDEIMGAMETIENDIASWGFTKLEVCGRKGWTKLMKPYGFELDRVILSKSIGDGHGW